MTTQYADLELQWIPILDRAKVQDEARAAGVMKRSVLGSSRHQQMRSPTRLRDHEVEWLLKFVPRETRAWINQLQMALARKAMPA